MPRGHCETALPRKFNQEILGDPIGKIVLLRVA
jgi:hypothetical protein